MSLFDANTEVYRRQRGITTQEVDTAIEREREYEELKTALRRTVDDGAEITVAIGPDGSGKTTLVRRGLNEISDQTNFTTISIDCASAGTLYRTLVRVVNEFRSDENALSKTGYSFDRVRRTLEDELESQSEPTILVLDGVDELENVDELGKLARRDKTGVVVIADDTGMSNRITTDAWPARSIVKFPQYTTEELRSLLQEWIETSLSNQPVAPETVPLCAAYGIERSGDAQYTLRLLRQGAAIASDERADQVRGRHVQAAKEEIERKEVDEQIDHLDGQNQLVLYTLTELGAAGELPARTTSVYNEYVLLLRKAAGIEANPRSKRRIQKRLNELVETGLVEYITHNEGRANGAYRKYELARNQETIRSALADRGRASSDSVSSLF